MSGRIKAVGRLRFTQPTAAGCLTVTKIISGFVGWVVTHVAFALNEPKPKLGRIHA